MGVDFVGRWVVGEGRVTAEASLYLCGQFEVGLHQREGHRLVELTDVYAHPFCRGRGWARVAAGAAIAYADRKQFDLYLRICVYGTVGKRVRRLDHAQLKAFYKSLGFVDLDVSQKEMVRRWASRPKGRSKNG